MGSVITSHYGRIRLSAVIVSILSVAFLVGILTHVIERRKARNDLGLFAMSSSVVLLDILEDISTNGTITTHGIDTLENVTYTSSLLAIGSDERFVNEPWNIYLDNLKTYMWRHNQETNSPVFEALIKRLQDARP